MTHNLCVSCPVAQADINPLLHSGHNSVRMVKISIIKLEGIIKNISVERRDYKSVDEKRLCILGYVPKNDEKKNPGSKRLK